MLCTTIFKLTISTKGSLININYEALPDVGFPLTLYLNERSGSQTLFRMIVKTYIFPIVCESVLVKAQKRRLFICQSSTGEDV